MAQVKDLLANHPSGTQSAVRGTEVFIGGLARTVTENKLREKDAAQRAIKEKSGLTIEGKSIGVLPSTEQDTLFLGNISKDWTANEFEAMVRQVFQDVASIDLAKPLGGGDASSGQKHQNRGFAFVKFSSHAAAARAYRVGSKSDFLLGNHWHPVVEWAEEEPEVDPDELAKVKIAFIRYLPANADESFIRELFEPLGKVEKVVLSKKSQFPVGYVHFENRSDLDNAIKELNKKTVKGPTGGPEFTLQVEVARPFGKTKKRVRDETQSKPAHMAQSQSKLLKGEMSLNSSAGQKSVVSNSKYLVEEPVVADSYEAAVVSLPAAIKERLLRILRLGIATRFDIDIHCIASLRELPQSAAISVLDQFMLSGAERHNKGAYLAELISRVCCYTFGCKCENLSKGWSFLIAFELFIILDIVFHGQLQVNKLGLILNPALSRVGHLTARDPEISRVGHFSSIDPEISRGRHHTSRDLEMSRVGHLTSRDAEISRVGHLASRDTEISGFSSRVLLPDVSSRASHGVKTAPRYEAYAAPEVRSHSTSYLDPLSRRLGIIDAEETGPALSRQTMISPTSYSKVGLDYITLASPSVHEHPASAVAPTRNHVRFDPVTGEPYKFDPFTGCTTRKSSLI
ncbi:Heterogeneous nuclear ribonucleoprotein Q acidic domain [Dillenia turbinata]|uniref:Heterogeneous nuclear ribonucleoprotein Q acidic domain n=1 Tax=Dillenia turbinata TaxID=194707 RepID=A0AAN8ULE5_9MAGN